jgi:hypothetical protein
VWDHAAEIKSFSLCPSFGVIWRVRRELNVLYAPDEWREGGKKLLLLLCLLSDDIIFVTHEWDPGIWEIVPTREPERFWREIGHFLRLLAWNELLRETMQRVGHYSFVERRDKGLSVAPP